MLRRVSMSTAILIAVLSLAACAPAEEPAPLPPATRAAPTVPSPTPSEGLEATTPPAEQVTMTRWDLWIGDAPSLRGANVWQRLIYPELDGLEYLGPGPVGPPYVQADFDHLAALGANYVNVSHPGLFTEAPPYAVNEDTQANLDALLAMIERADLFAVISFRTGPGRSTFTFVADEAGTWFNRSYLNDSVWEDQAAQDAWVEMWCYTADRYKDHPVVVGYDLMVEPNSDEIFFQIYDPAEFYPAYAGTLYDWDQFYPRITEGIRQVDPDMPILVGGMGYSAVAWLPYLQPTGDPRTVYTIHQYAPVDYTHQVPGILGGLPVTYPGERDFDGDGQVEVFDKAWLDDLLTPVDDFKARHGVPVACNEFGPMRFEPGAPQYMDDLMSLFEARGINHALWEWTPAWEPLHSEPLPFDFRLGTDPKNSTDDVPGDLQDVIVAYWSLNTLRPSLVRFLPANAP